MYLERLARCPGTEDRQGTADLAALETPEGVASFPAPLHFWAEETERNARWRPLRPGHWQGWQTDLLRALRRDGHRVMRCTPLFPRGLALTSPGPWHQDCLRSLLLEMTVLRPTSSLRQTRNQSLLRQIPMRHAWQGLPSRRVAY